MSDDSREALVAALDLLERFIDSDGFVEVDLEDEIESFLRSNGRRPIPIEAVPEKIRQGYQNVAEHTE